MVWMCVVDGVDVGGNVDVYIADGMDVYVVYGVDVCVVNGVDVYSGWCIYVVDVDVYAADVCGADGIGECSCRIRT